MKFGYQGYWWKDDREMHTNTQGLQYTFIGGVPDRRSRSTSTGYKVNARAMQASLYAQDQWTVKRLTLQGARPLRPSVELVPGDRPSRRAGSSPAPPSRRPTA